MENYDFVLKGANVKVPKKTTDNVAKSKKCNQCGYSSSHAGDLRKQLIHLSQTNATSVTMHPLMYSV